MNEEQEKERIEKLFKQLLEEGKITLDSPCANMYEEWTKEEEEEFDKVLAYIFGFK